MEDLVSALVMLLTDRSSRSSIFSKIGVLKNFAIFTGKHLCWKESLFNKVADLKI